MMRPRGAKVGYWALLALALTLALWLRVSGSGWGLPDYFLPDESVFTAQSWTRTQASEPSSADFIYPHLHHRTMSAVTQVAGALGFHEAGAAWEIRLGRASNAASGVLAVLLTFWIGRGLFGLKAGAVGAAFMAVAPVSVANGHVNASDGPLVLWIVASFAAAVRASRTVGLAQVGWLSLAAVLAGLASAVRYPGLAAVLPPLWLCLWQPIRSGGSPEPLRLGAVGAVVPLAGCVGIGWVVGFALGCPRCLPEWQMCVEAIQAMRAINFEGGASAKIPEQGWLAAPYWYQVAAVLPFSMGVVSCALGYLGLGSMAARRGRDALLVLAFALPYFIVIGGSQAAFARYCLPLVPFLCVAAGFWVTRARTPARRALLAFVATLALAHSTLFSVALVRGFGGDTRGDVIAWLEAAADQRYPARYLNSPPPLSVGLPYFTRRYDGLTERVDASPRLADQRIGPRDDPSGRSSPDFIVVSKPFALRVARGPARGANAYWKDLTTEKLGYTLARTFEPAFRAEGIYTVADPMLVHIWGHGDIGFSIYERASSRARGAR